MTSKFHWMLTLALGCAATASQAHDEAAPRAASPDAATAVRVPAPSGADASARRVARDPVTGQLRPPTEQEVATDHARTQATGPVAPLAVRVHSNGMKSAILGPDYLSTLMVERRPDGTLVKRHANPRDDHAHAMPTSSSSTPSTTKPAARGAATE